MILTYESVFRVESDFTQPLIRYGAIEGIEGFDHYGAWAARDSATAEVFEQLHPDSWVVIGDPPNQLWEALFLSTERENLLVMIAGKIRIYDNSLAISLWSHDVSG